MRVLPKILATVAILAGTPLSAESIQITSLRPARILDAVSARTIAIAQFGGAEGEAIEDAIGSALSRLMIDGKPYFRIVPDRAGEQADIRISGIGRTRVSERGVQEARNKCVERDQKGDCLRKADVQVDCVYREINYEGAVRIEAVSDGRRLAEWSVPGQTSKTFCEQETPRHFSDEEEHWLADFVDATAHRALDLAVYHVTEKISVAENRKGLNPLNEMRFKQALKATKSDPKQACGLWNEIDQEQPGHAATTYNIAICHEWSNDYDKAIAAYQQVFQMERNRSAIKDALRRIEGSRLGQAQLKVRGESRIALQ